MEPEDYYDSLDESSDCGSSKARNVSINSLKELGDSSDNLLLLPLYEGSLSLSHIDSNSKCSSRCSGILVQNRNTSKSRLKPSIAPIPKPKKSYLEMFYDRTGVNKYGFDGFIECDSARPTCSSLSPKSFTTCNGDVECDNVITVDLKSDSEISSESNQPLSKHVPELQLGMNKDGGDNKFHSVSDQSLNKRSVFSICSCNTKKVPVPSVIMVSKGTDTRTERLEQASLKLEAWKKRQQYGQRASETNRIKMKEERALRTLEKELKNSNKTSI